ncbi:MAG: hypothetical protein P4L16_05980 [Chlamydiales bacterium]|nr:hypothetical protein [Chlamydiales bacterium]
MNYLLRFLLFIFFFSSTTLFSDTLFLKTQFQKAHPGDFIVLEHDHTITFMHIHAKNDNTLLLEEVNLPEKALKDLRKKPSFSWNSWFQNGSAKNTSWIMYEISLNSGTILKSYSFTRRCLLNPSQIENFLPTLLNLPFTKIPEQNRKRVGRAPPSGERDKRPLWQPRMIVNGKVIPNIAFDGWKTTWPKDASPLSGTVVEIYLPANYKDAPTYFPYWLQVSDTLATAKIRLIDSGENAHSPYPGMP